MQTNHLKGESPMPKMIVGWTQKVGAPNYGSRGAHVTMELEIDWPTVASTDRARDQIVGLFRLARQTVTDELARIGPAPSGSAPTTLTNGHNIKKTTDGSKRGATANQIRAIRKLSDLLRVDLSETLRSRFAAGAPEELSLTDASALIDELKARA
jgi:hypothetical protein